MGRITLRAADAAPLAGSVDSVSAAAIGASGADMRTSVGTAVSTNAARGAAAAAHSLDLYMRNAVSRSNGSWNVQSGSGGAIAMPIGDSRVTVNRGDGNA